MILAYILLVAVMIIIIYAVFNTFRTPEEETQYIELHEPPAINSRSYFYHNGIPYYVYGGYYYNPMGYMITDLIFIDALEMAYADLSNHIIDSATVNEIAAQNDAVYDETNHRWEENPNAPLVDAPLGDDISQEDNFPDGMETHLEPTRNDETESFDNTSSSSYDAESSPGGTTDC